MCLGCSGSWEGKKLKGLANGLHCGKWGNYGVKWHIDKTLLKKQIISYLYCTMLCYYGVIQVIIDTS